MSMQPIFHAPDFRTKGEGHLSFFDHRFSLLLVGVDGGNDYVGGIAVDLGSLGFAVFDFPVGDPFASAIF